MVYHVQLTAEPSLLSGDLAVAQGTSEEYVKTSAGEFKYTGTWTAVMRHTDAGWKLVRSQMTMDPFRNPVVHYFEKRGRIICGLGSLILGALAGFCFGRMGRRRVATAA